MHTTRHSSEEQGFSYLDVLIAVTILMIGVLTFSGVLAVSFMRTNQGAVQLRAKALATTTLESVMGARYVQVGGNPYSFDAIQNTTKPGGVFVVGRQPIREKAGPDGLYGTADDNGNVIPGLEREVIITDVNDPRRPSPPNPITERRITVRIYYGNGQIQEITTGVCNY